MLNSINNRIESTKEQYQLLLQERDEILANTTFVCICGQEHKVKDCIGIQEYYYESPYSCSGGDNWYEDGLSILCPELSIKNRILFLSEYEIPYEKRKKLEYSKKLQFQHNCKKLFKDIINEYDRSNYRWKNNLYIDNNSEKFGIVINKGV